MRIKDERACDLRTSMEMLPLGIDSFEKIRREGYYYIDKTRFILELLSRERFEVSLITRPRRFGKTLAVSMLADFFDIRKDSRSIFEGLEVAQNKKICADWMNQWPVLSITFKDVEDLVFDEAIGMLADLLADLCIEHSYLAASDKVDSDDKKDFTLLKSGNASGRTVRSGIYLLMRMMHAHYGKPVILLIDEYDVPLAKAYEHGYYEQMLNYIRSILSRTLKTNRYLKFAVVTGCLRIAKESIFTGTNHFVSNSISSDAYTDIFGFTKEEVGALLADAGLENRAEDIRRWYDGYQIGSSKIYCPWDVMNYIRDLINNPEACPRNYWKDTSHNDIVRSFIGKEEFDIAEKLENLLGGGSIKVWLRDDLSYDMIHSSEENFWNILYLTGYLTNDCSNAQELEQGEAYLRIPNEEVKTIFAETIAVWFKDSMGAYDRGPLMTALWTGEEENVSFILAGLLFRTISYHNYKEDFYHAFLAGIFVGLGYAVESDREYGEGRPDLVIKDNRNQRVLVIEVKKSKSAGHMESDCALATDQLLIKKYADEFLDGYHKIVCYSIAFYKKQCLVRLVSV